MGISSDTPGNLSSSGGLTPNITFVNNSGFLTSVSGIVGGLVAINMNQTYYPTVDTIVYGWGTNNTDMYVYGYIDGNKVGSNACTRANGSNERDASVTLICPKGHTYQVTQIGSSSYGAWSQTLGS